MLDAHRAFLDSLDPESARLQNSPNFIFLCGGRYSGAGTPIQSARHFLLVHLKEIGSALLDRIKLADEINDWYDDNVFPDLLELEEYIANLSTVVVGTIRLTYHDP